MLLKKSLKNAVVPIFLSSIVEFNHQGSAVESPNSAHFSPLRWSKHFDFWKARFGFHIRPRLQTKNTQKLVFVKNKRVSTKRSGLPVSRLGFANGEEHIQNMASQSIWCINLSTSQNMVFWMVSWDHILNIHMLNIDQHGHWVASPCAFHWQGLSESQEVEGSSVFSVRYPATEIQHSAGMIYIYINICV